MLLKVKTRTLDNETMLETEAKKLSVSIAQSNGARGNLKISFAIHEVCRGFLNCVNGMIRLLYFRARHLSILFSSRIPCMLRVNRRSP